MFRDVQRRIALFALLAVAVSVAVVFAPIPPFGVPADIDGTAGRLAFAARWMLVPGVCLLVGIGVLANTRYMLPEAIDGQTVVENRAFEVNRRYNLNTLEQTVLAAIAWTGLALALPEEDLSLIPRLAVLFGVGRIAFWIGYLIAPWARGFGMGLTVYPTFGAFAWLVWTALT
jgi:hypothetical protein